MQILEGMMERPVLATPRAHPTGDGIAQSVLDVFTQQLFAGDTAPVPRDPQGAAPGLQVNSLVPTNSFSVSFCRCGDPGPEIHPEGSLQPVHQVQEHGVTLGQRRLWRGRPLCSAVQGGGHWASPPSPWLAPTPTPLSGCCSLSLFCVI